jgi:superfamily I DNA/RNA helicase
MRIDAAHEAVAACQDRHQLVVAPPGTGKTHIAVRLAGLMAAELPLHSRVLLLTFSREARSQLEREAARQLSPECRRGIEITNYHRLFSQGINAYKRVLGLPDVIDVGSTRRRSKALRQASEDGWRAVKAHAGLCDSLAEHAFEGFKDRRTPAPELLEPLLSAVDAEHRAGRLVFDDFGALWWRLMESQDSVAQAYAIRYPVVIADEHQDASALQDAVARRLGTQRLVVLADHMQLIHGFRGADLERLRAHWRDSDTQHELSTPHRWHARRAEAEWLLAFRERISGKPASAPRPEGVRETSFRGERGINGALFALKTTVPALLRGGNATVAVLVRENADLGRMRNYMIRNGMRPRQLGGPKDFEEARQDIEQLPLLTEPETVARHAYDRLLEIVPSVPKTVADQVKRRLRQDGPDRVRAKPEASALLGSFEAIYRDGASGYFQAMSQLLGSCRELGYHMPRSDAGRAIEKTAAALAPDCDVQTAVTAYSEQVAASAHHAPQRADRGLFIMTAHQSKGKEFDAVVIAPLDARRWPDNEESRLLFYVALTRATKSWSLIVPSNDASPLLGLVP